MTMEILYRDHIINTWENIPIIPKCLKIQSLLFIVFVLLIMLNLSCALLILCFSVWVFVTLYQVYLQKMRVKDTRNWQKVKAKIISKQTRRGSPFGATRLFPYIMDITYKYTIDKQNYISNKYAVESCMEPSMNYIYSKEEAEDILRSLSKKEGFDIFVNPNCPEDSIIERGNSSTNSPSYILMVVAFVIPALFLAIKCLI